MAIEVLLLFGKVNSQPNKVAVARVKSKKKQLSNFRNFTASPGLLSWIVNVNLAKFTNLPPLMCILVCFLAKLVGRHSSSVAFATNH